MNGILTQEERTMNIPLLKKQMECFLDSIVISGKYKSMTDDEITSLSWPEFVSVITEPELIQYLKERRLYVNEPVTETEEY